MALEKIISIIRGVDFFSAFNDEQLRLLAFASEMQIYAPREVIVAKDKRVEGAFILIRGTLIISSENEIENKSYFVSTPNTLIGEKSLLLNKAINSLIISSEKSELLFIPNKAFFKLLRQYPQLAEKMAKRIEKNLENYLRSFDKLRKINE